MLITIKKIELTKSIINQIQVSKFSNLVNCDTLGFFVNKNKKWMFFVSKDKYGIFTYYKRALLPWGICSTGFTYFDGKFSYKTSLAIVKTKKIC